MAVRAGKLRHRVTIERASPKRDAHGSVDPNYQVLAEVWASVDPIGGRELVEAQAVQSELTHRVRMRGGADVTPKDRIVHSGRTFDVLSVLDREERGHELLLACKERI